MTIDKDKFMYFNEIKKDKNVNLGNNSPAAIKGKGIVLLKKKVKAGNVLFADGLRHNLLSFSQISDPRHEVVFRSKNCLVRNFNIGNIIIKGTRTLNNVYVLEGGQKYCYLRKCEES